jgi:hypothetical protein
MPEIPPDKLTDAPPEDVRQAARLGWHVFESEIFPMLGLGRAWFSIAPEGYTGRNPFPPPGPPLPNLLELLDPKNQPRRERGPAVHRRRRQSRVLRER